MERKVTKEEFIQVIENNEENLYDYQLAEKLGITPVWFCQLKKEYKEDIRDLAKEMTIKSAAEMVNMLLSLARHGDTSAARISAAKSVLEMAGVYKQKIDAEIDNKKPFILNILNHSSRFTNGKYYDDPQKEKSGLST